MIPDIESLKLRQGEQVTAGHVNKLVSLVSRQQSSGVNVRKRVLPWGTITHYEGGGGNGGTAPTFAPSVSRVSEGFAVRFERGIIAGVEPSLNGIAMSKVDPATGQRPALIVPASLLAERGEVGIYFRVSLSREWTAEKAEPFASVDVPKLEAWKADKLACILYENGQVWRALYFNLGHEATRRGLVSDGRATHLFFAQ